ncbi:Integrator complex subunit 3 [Entomophthora muscae]|uniref:Integrator complex subunit 3 n=1 Tax=Entomophthora muscae TaxID=34485 RepID=A0ACC2RSD2_9FUNG|nr:Integrator complex subunit 3 [Entomophthora muscae]
MGDRDEVEHPRMFNLKNIDQPNEIEQILIRGFKTLSHLSRDKSEMELHNEIQAKASQSMELHNELVQGLLYSMLTIPDNAERHFQILSFVVRDSYNEILARLEQITNCQDFLKLEDTCKIQLVWIADHLTELRIQGIQNTLRLLIRQSRSGDFSQCNLLFTEKLLDLLTKNRKWVEQDSSLTALSCYFFLRSIKEHVKYPALQEKEIKLCLELLHNKFEFCALVGRELVRALHDVARIPEFKQLWKVLLHEPKTLWPQFEGIYSLLKHRTNPWYFEFRFPPDLTERLYFIMSKVSTTNQRFYFQWFQKLYLSSPAAHVLLPDLVRFICASYHPSNDILAGGIIPRYEVINLLVREIQDPVLASDCKLSLFYDWLFFSRDNSIMDIEPGLLLMVNSLENNAYMTEVLVEFLAIASMEYCPSLKEHIHKNIESCMELLLEKGVISSLEPHYHNPNLSMDTKNNLLGMFGRFLNVEYPRPAAVPFSHPREANPPFPGNYEMPVFMDDEEVVPNFSPPETSEITPIQASEPAQSHEERDAYTQHSPQAHYQYEQAHFQNKQPSPVHIQNEQAFPESPHHSPEDDDSETRALFGGLFKDLRAAVFNWSYDNKGILDSILEIFVTQGMTAEQLVDKLESIFSRYDNYFLEISSMPHFFLDQLFPRAVYIKALSQNSNEEEMDLYDSEQGIDFPAISLFEKVWQTFFKEVQGSLLCLEKSPPAEREQARLLVKLAARLSSIGPYWLVYTLREFSSLHPDMTCPPIDPTCKYPSESPHPFQAYAHFVHLVSAETGVPPSKTVLSDMSMLMEMEKTAFYSILPSLFRFLPMWCLNNAALIHMAAEGLDAIQFTYTISRIYRKALNIMTYDGLQEIIAESFGWDPSAQVNFWVFVIAQFGGDQTAAEIILRAFVRYSNNEGLEDNSDQGEVIVKLSDILQRVPPTSGLLSAMFVGCHQSVIAKRLGMWFVIMLSQWAQQWSSLLHFNLRKFVTTLVSDDIAALGWENLDPDKDSEAYGNDVMQWLKLLHCWCDPNSFPGIPTEQQGITILLSVPNTREMLKQLVSNYQAQGLNPDDFPFFFQNLDDHPGLATTVYQLENNSDESHVKRPRDV